jgi:hypothetical protein
MKKFSKVLLGMMAAAIITSVIILSPLILNSELFVGLGTSIKISLMLSIAVFLATFSGSFLTLPALFYLQSKKWDQNSTYLVIGFFSLFLIGLLSAFFYIGEMTTSFIVMFFASILAIIFAYMFWRSVFKENK